MRSAVKTSLIARRRPRRAPADDDEPRRAIAKRIEWLGPSRRAKLIAIGLAVVIAACTFAIVSRSWIYGAPAPKALGPVEVKLIVAPAPPPTVDEFSAPRQSPLKA